MEDFYVRVITYSNPTLNDEIQVIVCRNEQSLKEQLKRLESLPHITNINSVISRIY